MTRLNSFLLRLLTGLMLVIFSMTADAEPQLTLNEMPDVLQENIRNTLNVASLDCNLKGWQLKSRARDFREQAQQAAKAVGYYQTEIKASVKPVDDCWQLDLNVIANPPVRYSRIDINIDNISQYPGLQPLLKQQPFKTGDRLDHGEYDAYKQELEQTAQSLGFFDAQLTRHELVVDLAEYTGRIHLNLIPGTRYQIGQIDIQHEILSDSFLQRFITLREGDPYSAESIALLQRRLTNSGYFSEVVVDPSVTPNDAKVVDLTIKLLKSRRHQYSIGVGVSTDTGPRIKLSYGNRYVNKRGHQFDADTIFSAVQTGINTVYTIPLRQDRQENLKIISGYLDEDTDTSETRSYDIGASYNRLLDSGWLSSTSLTYIVDDFEVSNQTGQTTLLVPKLTLSKSVAAEIRYPLSGWRIDTELDGAHRSVISDVSFAQISGRAKLIHPLLNGRMLYRVEAGYTETNAFDELPPRQRFFAGGDQSVRGYDFEELGPRNNLEEVIGGRKLLVGSVEYDHRITDSIALAAFFDAGNAFNGTDIDPQRGTGVGVRYLSPIGPIRLDVATALDDDNSIRFHISMGPDL